MRMESDELFAEIRVIRSRIEGIEHTQEILVRAQHKQILPALLEMFENDPTLARIYLLIDGQRSQREVVQALRGQGHEISSEATVSRKIDRLANDLALVDLIDQTRKGKIYRRSAVDRILGLSRLVQKMVNQGQG